ncbi:hypothetical protein [Novosphingobium sp.]|uniref:hypothetical protein n=1 Tax=Novosphingobium sp. TaxID=1874826 RepID=UPI0025FE5049|nr:hypothetical protein [Novosphingobium sp.]MCC6925613.1 hypothetical protein [Novosphingobium sp.]
MLKILAMLPVVALLIGFAKMTQYAAVGAFGDTIGPNLAAMLGGGSVIAFYYWAAIKLPKFNTFGLSRG